jgi:hypothetical protein
MHIAALAVAAPSASAQGDLVSAMDTTLSLVQRLHAKWDSLVAPVARKQAVLSLQRLSLALDDLALAKIEFSEKVAAADWERQPPDLSDQAQDLISSVQSLRRRIRGFLRFVPNSYQATAGKIENQLVDGLTQKVGNLTDIQNLMKASAPSVAAIRSETDEAVRRTRAVKAAVDSLSASIQNSSH